MRWPFTCDTLGNRRENCDIRRPRDPRSWEKWVERYEGKGYRVLALAYPGFEVEALNEVPSPIETLTIPAVVEHLENILGELDRSPITVLLPNYKRWGTQISCNAHRKRCPASRSSESLVENDTSVLFSIY